MEQRLPNILILNRTFPPRFGATGRLAFELAKHLSAQGHPVTVVTTGTKNEKQKNIKIIRVTGDERPNGAWDYFKILKRMERAAKKSGRHHVVISMTDPPMLAVVGHKIAKSMSAKHIHWAMDIYPDLFDVLGVQLPRLATAYIHRKIYGAMRAADAVVAISECMARHLTYKAVPRSKIHVMENWPEAIVLNDSKSMPRETDKFRILYAGTMGLAHEFEAILKAASYFQKHAPEIEFVFVGGGRGRDALRAKVKRKNLSNIRFAKHQPEAKLKSMMESGDIHLVTMKDTAAGLLYPSKFYAGCAVGRPVIFVGPKACSLHDVIKKNGCGVSVRSSDFQSLIKAIQSYRDNADLWHRHSQNAKTIVKNCPQRNFEAWNKLISSI